MSNERVYKLSLELVGPFGEKGPKMVILLPDDMGERIAQISPPTEVAPFEATFDVMVELLRRKEFRKHILIENARRLGALLAERMEDAEGWHDADRIEPAREQLGWKPKGRLG